MPLLDDLKDKAREIGVDAGLVKPTVKEKLIKGVKGVGKDVREAFGMPSGIMEGIEEFVTTTAEKSGVKDPRVGKSLLGVIKSAFGMIAAIAGSDKEQAAAEKEFDKACKTFSKAMSALFKTKSQEHAKDEKKPAQKPKAKENPSRDPKRAAQLKDIEARNEARKKGRGR